MKVHVQLFSIVREIAGTGDVTLNLDAGAVAEDVVKRMAETHPALGDWKRSLRVAVNREYVSDNHALKEGDEVAIIPPVSGG